MTATPPAPPVPAKRWHWEDFTPGLVIDLGRTAVTREAVLAFAGQFDPQPFHLDDAAAEASLFGRLAASGWHTCAMTMRLMCDGYLNDSAGLGSPGLDELRWLKPVYPGDTLHAEMTVLESRPMNSRPAVGLVLSRWRVSNQDGVDVMTMQGWGMFGPPAPGGLSARAMERRRCLDVIGITTGSCPLRGGSDKRLRVCPC